MELNRQCCHVQSRPNDCSTDSSDSFVDDTCRCKARPVVAPAAPSQDLSPGPEPPPSHSALVLLLPKLQRLTGHVRGEINPLKHGGALRY